MLTNLELLYPNARSLVSQLLDSTKSIFGILKSDNTLNNHELQAILKSKQCPCIFAIKKNNCSSKNRFNFSFVEKKMKLEKKLICFELMKQPSTLTFQQTLLNKILI